MLILGYLKQFNRIGGLPLLLFKLITSAEMSRLRAISWHAALELCIHKATAQEERARLAI